MHAIAVLFAARLADEAFEPLSGDSSSVDLAVGKALAFPGVDSVVLLASPDFRWKSPSPRVRVDSRPSWGKKSLLLRLSELAAGDGLEGDSSFDLLYFAWADAPLLDPALAKAIADRHLRYAAEYSYADGYPYGLAPELLSPGTPGALAFLAKEDEGRVERDLLFSVLQKDINSFDIETELSPVDLRLHRLSLTADSRRNLLLVRRFLDAGGTAAGDVESLISQRPELLRTLPAFYAIQVSGPCPQACAVCPYPRFAKKPEGAGILDRRDFMRRDDFSALLDRIAAFSGDAVIDLSLWGEISLHPEAESLIQAVLDRPALSLVLETSGIGWAPGALERLASAVSRALPRRNGQSPLSIIISLDSNEERRYREVRGEGFAEAQSFAASAVSLFPKDAYVQALRLKGAEEDLEAFYRFWKARTANVIVQKHDDFAGALETLKAADLSPVKRQSCWHLMRDMTILLDGTVVACREELEAKRSWGNALSDDLSLIWERGNELYLAHAHHSWPGICEHCDEYYTYNF